MKKFPLISLFLIEFLSITVLTSCSNPDRLSESAPTQSEIPGEAVLPHLGISEPALERTENIDPTLLLPAANTPVPTSWKIYKNSTLQIQFQYPEQWESETAERMSGSDGFVEVAVRDFPRSLFDALQTVCVLEANGDQAAVYGKMPLIADWQSQAVQGCMILPSEDLSKDRSTQAVLFARFPQSSTADRLLVLRADSLYFSGILNTLIFLNAPQATVSSGIYDSPACQFVQGGAPQVVFENEALSITETAITTRDCDPWNQYDGFRKLAEGLNVFSERAAVYKTGFRQQAQEINQVLARFDYRLVEYSSASSGSFDLYYQDERVLSGLTHLGPVSVNSSGNDFILWVQNSFESEPPIEVSMGQTRTASAIVGEFNTAWVGNDRMRFEYASEPLLPVGSPGRVNIIRNSRVVDTLVNPPFGPAGDPVENFWSWDGHWWLEMDGVVVRDGQLLNQQLGYAEIFNWGLLNQEPFFLFQKQAQYGLNFAGQELPIFYDDIIHGQLCCGPGIYNIASTPLESNFFARRGDIWYFVQVQGKES